MRAHQDSGRGEESMDYGVHKCATGETGMSGTRDVDGRTSVLVAILILVFLWQPGEAAPQKGESSIQRIALMVQ